LKILWYGAAGFGHNARILAPHLEKILGNRSRCKQTGGRGEIAYTMLAKANPDGTPWIDQFSGHHLNPLVQKVSYTMNDFAYIGNSFITKTDRREPDSKIKTFEDFIAEAKAKAGKLNVGNSGPYADDHLHRWRSSMLRDQVKDTVSGTHLPWFPSWRHIDASSATCGYR